MEPQQETIACGAEFSLFVDINQEVWSCGSNTFMQLGRDTYKFRPQKISELQGIVAVTGGDKFGACLDSSGSIYIQGYLQGTVDYPHPTTKLGDKHLAHHLGTDAQFPVFKYINGHRCPRMMLVDNEGSAWVCGLFQNGATLLRKLSNLPEIVSGVPTLDGRFAYFLDIGGGVWTYAMNGTSVFVQIENLPKIKQVCCSNTETFFIDYEGYVYARGAQQALVIPVPISHMAGGASHFIFTDNEERAWGIGENTYGQLGVSPRDTSKLIPIHNGVKMAACGNLHSLILDGEGSVWSTGYNQQGQLGIGESSAQYAFIKVPKLPEIVSLYHQTSVKSARK